MMEPKTFCDESTISGKIYYEIHEKGLIYRPGSDEMSSFGWQDIEYIEDRSGDRVDIVTTTPKEIPVRYATNEFPVLLRSVCLKLSEIRKENFYPHKFTLALNYWLHFSFVISVLVLSLIGSLLAGKALFFTLLALFAPLGIIIQRHPISLTLDNRCLTVRYLLLRRAYNFNEIRDMDFEVKSNDYGSTLCILVNLKNRKKMTVKKIENIFLFFIMLQIKLNEQAGSKECIHELA